jgi:hypothetical protein
VILSRIGIAATTKNDDYNKALNSIVNVQNNTII